jgi:peptide-methionine (S)-S-oxide reductase
MSDQNIHLETATLGGGCFWCVEAVFQELRGVHQVVSGYSGGHVKNPTYEQICSKQTGHAEVVQVHFNPKEVPYEDILRVFFTAHDPTTPNRQGNDVGPQYRSVIFTHSDEQQATAERVKQEIEAEGIYDHPIVTEVSPLINWYPAEDYHQNYFRNNSLQPYCTFVIGPKVAKFRKLYADRLKSKV